MTEMIAVKAICDNDTRRFSIDPALKFAGLKDEILTRFGLSADNLKLKFKDDEGGTSQHAFRCVSDFSGTLNPPP